MRSLSLILTVLAAAGLSACAGSANTGGSAAVSLPQPDVAAAERLISPDETLQTLTFPAEGSTSVNGRVVGYKTVSYAVPVAQGQRLEVELRSDSSNAYFNIHDAADSSGAAVFNGNTGARVARLTAPRDMTFVIRPFQPRASARRGESFEYTFLIDRR
jgi:hypothetical protein